MVLCVTGRRMRGSRRVCRRWLSVWRRRCCWCTGSCRRGVTLTGFRCGFTGRDGRRLRVGGRGGSGGKSRAGGGGGLKTAAGLVGAGAVLGAGGAGGGPPPEGLSDDEKKRRRRERAAALRRERGRKPAGG